MPPMRPVHRVLSWIVVLVWPSAVAADALPPRRNISCPRGTELVHDHSGTNCVKERPKNCPPGWVGRLGGTCHLATCENDDNCESRGKLVCRKSDVCSHVAQRTGWGGSDVRSPLLAGPPRIGQARVFTDVCRGGSCQEPSRCGSYGICLPANVAAPAPRPPNGAETWSFDVGPDVPPTGNEAAVQPPAAAGDAGALAPISFDPVVDPTPPGKSGGCAGCATAPCDRRARAGILGLALVAGLVLGRRSARR
jgi:hypothetical protein